MRALKTTWPRGPHRPGGPRGRGTPAKPSALGIAFVAAALLAPAAGGAGRLVARQASTLAGTQGYTLDLDLQAAPKIAGAHIGTFQQAVRTFGEPTLASATVATAPACKAVWPRLGLEIDFAATAAASCSAPLLGRWLNVVATAPRWHTTAGLRVGDTENRLRVLYTRT